MSDSIYTEPEMLGRLDTAHGKWDVGTCSPVRGEPMTNNVDRKMLIPVHDSQESRVIRAHEMMHAKISPAGDWGAWLARKIATEKSLVAVEELRVNFLCNIAGFPMKQFLSDGSEDTDGEKLAILKDWSALVRMCVATVDTASHKKFLVGVRRHNKEWAKALQDIGKRCLKQFRGIPTNQLSSTAVHDKIGLSPMGFGYTERLAEWIDRLCDITPPEETKQGSGSKDESDSADGELDKSDSTSSRLHSNVGIGEPAEALGERIKSITPSSVGGKTPYWGELVFEHLPLPRYTRGSIGKKRIASNTGKSPRRMHRLVTDPQMRIFDKRVKGIGGVVLIDASGSMSFTHDQIRLIVEASPGALVACYTDNNRGDDDKPANIWILANKGRMVENLPTVGHGNGVDFPALEWALKQKQRSNSPVIWVSDGGVCGPNQHFSDLLALQCVKFVKKNRILVFPHVEEAIKALTAMQKNQKVETVVPPQLENIWRQKNGVSS